MHRCVDAGWNCVQCVRLRLTTILIRLLITYFWYTSYSKAISHSENWKRKRYTKNHLITGTVVRLRSVINVVVFFSFFAYVNNISTFVCELQLPIGIWSYTQLRILSAFLLWNIKYYSTLVALAPNHEPCIGVSFSMFCLFHLFSFIFRSFSFRWARMHAIFYKCESNDWICTNMLRADGSGGGGGNGSKIVWWMLGFLLFIIFSYCLCFGRVTCTLHVLFNINFVSFAFGI